jgi:hypothetical protein
LPMAEIFRSLAVDELLKEWEAEALKNLTSD